MKQKILKELIKLKDIYIQAINIDNEYDFKVFIYKNNIKYGFCNYFKDLRDELFNDLCYELRKEFELQIEYRSKIYWYLTPDSLFKIYESIVVTEIKNIEDIKRLSLQPRLKNLNKTIKRLNDE